MNKKSTYRAISLVSLLVMAVAILCIVYTLYLYQKANREYLQLAQEARAAAEAAAAAEQMDETQEPETPEGQSQQPDEQQQGYAVIPINFDYLTSLNEDIIAWIEVQGTEVDYPVLYDTTTVRYYLSHNYSGAFSPFGSAFVLSDNAWDFNDFNTVVYGHNLPDGSMFASLHRFEDQEFFDKNKTIVVYTPERMLCYQVFAAYRTDNLDQLKNFKYDTAEDRQAYLDRIYTHDVKAIFDPDVEVTPDDRIITLSTCIGNPSYRYLVQGVLISDMEGISAAAPVN